MKRQLSFLLCLIFLASCSKMLTPVDDSHLYTGYPTSYKSSSQKPYNYKNKKKEKKRKSIYDQTSPQTTESYNSRYKPSDYNHRTKDVKVKGHYRKNGTYVRPHYRSSPRKK